MFITVFTKVLNLSLSWVIFVQSTPFLWSVLLFPHLHPALPSGLPASDFPTNALYALSGHLTVSSTQWRITSSANAWQCFSFATSQNLVESFKSKCMYFSSLALSHFPRHPSYGGFRSYFFLSPYTDLYFIHSYFAPLNPFIFYEHYRSSGEPQSQGEISQKGNPIHEV